MSITELDIGYGRNSTPTWFRILRYLPILVLGLLSYACSDIYDDGDTSSSRCSGTETYTVVFNATWSSSTHPTDFPSNPHFSGLIGGTHNENVSFWTTGETASSGIENMAELGSKTDLNSEVTSAISAGTADSVLSGDGISVSPDSVSLQFEISSDHTKVTLVSMIAPSPDWFVGISGEDLCDDGSWVDTKAFDLYAYDAGTDSGSTYTSADSDTDPKENITRLTTGIFEVNGTVPTLGTFTFTKN